MRKLLTVIVVAAPLAACATKEPAYPPWLVKGNDSSELFVKNTQPIPAVATPEMAPQTRPAETLRASLR